MSYLEDTIAEISRKINSREVTVSEVIESTFERIELLNPELNAFISLNKQQALENARNADTAQKQGTPLESLHGIPIAVKDLFATKDTITTAGSSILSKWTPSYDATVVKKLKQAGAIIIGKTNMDEFAFGGNGENDHYGVIKNPWDKTRSPGGSSGGSAVAVASSMAYGAIGTDTAASVRNPAHFCGLVGLKPSYGRVSLSGVIPLSWSLDHVGPITKTVEDTAILLNAIAGYDPNDDSSSTKSVPDYTALLNKPISKMKIGVLKGYFWNPIDPSVESAMEDALHALRDLGAVTTNIELKSAEKFPLLMNTIMPAEAAAYHHKWLTSQQDKYGSKILDRLLPGLIVNAHDYINAQRIRETITKETIELFKNYDALVTPTVPYTAAKIGETMVDVGNTRMEASSARTKNLFPFNALGLPAMSIPCGFDDKGLPIGLQIIGKPFQESEILQIGNAYQTTTDWHTKRPSGLTI